MKHEIMRPEFPIADINLTDENKYFYLETAKQMDARRVWIALLDRTVIFSKDRSEYLDKIRGFVEFFRAGGLEVGYWTSTLGFGGPLNGMADITDESTKDWDRITPVRGGVQTGDAFCPTNPQFSQLMVEYFTDLASLGTDLIMLDDEFCLSVRPGIGCFCKRHMAMMENILGEELVLDEMPKKIFTGGRNRYREAWYQTEGDAERAFCALMRKTVDAVNPNIRMGLCAGYTSWDIEGLDVRELSKILAGNTKPFFRFTGAPYWVSGSSTIQNHPGMELNDVIELARVQKVWSQDEDIEFFAENDTYPRPAYHVSTGLMEQFEFAMQAEGIRSLKYVCDYVSSPEYEPKYIKIHNRNMPLYQKIRDIFGDKKATGVRVFYPMRSILDRVLPDEFIGEWAIMRMFFSRSVAMMTGVGIPIKHEGEADCAAIFGEEVRCAGDITRFKKVILDLPAAQMLTEQGIDVGLTSWKQTEVPFREYFGEERLLTFGAHIGTPLDCSKGFYNVTLKDGAVVESMMQTGEGMLPSSYRYHNGTTEFLVLAFDTMAVGESSTFYRSYCRQQQLMDFVGGAYPYIKKHPHLYSLCAESEDGNTQAVLFENLSIDAIYDFTIELGRPCKAFTLVGAEGILSEDRTRIYVSQDFAPFSALALEVSYL